MWRHGLVVVLAALCAVVDTRALSAVNRTEARQEHATANATKRYHFSYMGSHRVLPDLHAGLWGHESRIDDVDFTLATQCSLNRLWMLREICARWGGAIVVVVAVEQPDGLEPLAETLQLPGESHSWGAPKAPSAYISYEP